jgi:hypothetical protein
MDDANKEKENMMVFLCLANFPCSALFHNCLHVPNVCACA